LFDVKTVFSERLNEDDRQYLLSDIKVQQGCFTGYSSPEAIMSFRDHNQCHAAGYSEVWLLRFDGNWQAVRKLADHDRCRFRLVDLENDGRDEIWIESRGGNQGQFFTEGKLLAFRDYIPHTLYSHEGRNFLGAGREGLASHSHEISFADVDKDGILELVDKEEKSWFAWTGRKWDSDYQATRTSTKKHIYSFTSGTPQAADQSHCKEY